MSTISPINEPRSAFPCQKQFEMDQSQTSMQFRCKTHWLPKYRLLIFPSIDLLLTLFLIHIVGQFGPDGERSGITLAVFAFAIMGLIRTWFLILDLKCCFNITLRNRTDYRTLTTGFTVPVNKDTGQIDTTKPLILDRARYSFSEVKEIVITARVTPKQRHAGVMYGYKKEVYLGDKTEKLPELWSIASQDHVPIFAPTLILEDKAYQLYETRDWREAMEFTRYLRISFGFKTPIKLLGMFPFQIEGLAIWETVLYPCIGILALTGSVILTALLTRTVHPILTLFTVSGFYALQVGLMVLCSRTAQHKAVTISIDKLAWLQNCLFIN